MSVVKVYGKLSFAPAGISTPYLIAVKFLRIAAEE
jgi:hypothetical protein